MAYLIFDAQECIVSLRAVHVGANAPRVHSCAKMLNLYFLKPSYIYRKVASSNTSCLEAHAGFFRLLMKGIFDPYVL